MTRLILIVMHLGIAALAMDAPVEVPFGGATGLRLKFFLDQHSGLADRLQANAVPCAETEGVCLSIYLPPQEGQHGKVFDKGMHTDIDGRTFMQRLNATGFDVSNLTKTLLVEAKRDAPDGEIVMREKTEGQHRKFVTHEDAVEVEAYRRGLYAPAMAPTDPNLARIFRKIAGNNAIYCERVPAIIAGTRNPSDCELFTLELVEGLIEVSADRRSLELPYFH